jgi:hypothetical protein
MRRRVLIALLAFGTLAGYSSGFASLYRWHRYGSSYAGCHHGRGYDYRYNSNMDRWAPPPPATPPGPQAQAQAPATAAPAEPGPR